MLYPSKHRQTKPQALRIGSDKDCKNPVVFRQMSNYGTPWTESEIYHTVSSYFRMLEAQTRGEQIVKRQEIAALQGVVERSSHAIQYKYQNISAVLAELGFNETLQGFAPRNHYQIALKDAVIEYLRHHVLI